MSGGVRKQYIGKEWTDDRWFGIYQKGNTMALPTFPALQNLRSFHITDSAEEKVT